MKQNKILSLISVALLVALLFLFSFFLVFESVHHCEQSNCPVCSCLQMCEQVLHRIKDTPMGWQPAVCFPMCFLISVTVKNEFWHRASLVEKRVRLNR